MLSSLLNGGAGDEPEEKTTDPTWCAAYEIVVTDGLDTTWREDLRYEEECR